MMEYAQEYLDHDIKVQKVLQIEHVDLLVHVGVFQNVYNKSKTIFIQLWGV